MGPEAPLEVEPMVGPRWCLRTPQGGWPPLRGPPLLKKKCDIGIADIVVFLLAFFGNLFSVWAKGPSEVEPKAPPGRARSPLCPTKKEIIKTYVSFLGAFLVNLFSEWG